MPLARLTLLVEVGSRQQAIGFVEFRRASLPAEVGHLWALTHAPKLAENFGGRKRYPSN
jgi:hypothetical protein